MTNDHSIENLLGVNDSDTRSISELVSAVADVSDPENPAFLGNPLFTWSMLHHRWLTVEEYEDYAENPVGDVTPERFKDIPQNDAPVIITQTLDGEVLSATPSEGTVIGIPPSRIG